MSEQELAPGVEKALVSESTALRILSVAEILAATDLEERLVPVPQWDGAVRVRGLTKQQQQELRAQATNGGEVDQDLLELYLFVAGVVEPQFSQEQAILLRDKSAGAVDAVLKAIAEVSGMAAGAVKKAEAAFRKG
ncbi:MAG: hypothetical protein M0Z94_16430 [Dehalococcoidales bacterium]|nr:hypothetical protein [Dehalococcoidales bacterium]